MFEMKAYVKPELFYESFELSQNIAACGWDMTNDKDVNGCYAVGDSDFSTPNIKIFMGTHCDIGPEGYEGFCYETGTVDAFRTFRS